MGSRARARANPKAADEIDGGSAVREDQTERSSNPAANEMTQRCMNPEKLDDDDDDFRAWRLLFFLSARCIVDLPRRDFFDLARGLSLLTVADRFGNASAVKDRAAYGSPDRYADRCLPVVVTLAPAGLLVRNLEEEIVQMIMPTNSWIPISASAVRIRTGEQMIQQASPVQCSCSAVRESSLSG